MFLLFLSPRLLFGQVSNGSSEAGLPFFIEHYSPHATPQNWGITQDSSGMIYVANNDGILVYDGVSWRMIQTETQGVVRSLAAGPENTIYVGVQGDLGYLHPDSTGALKYRSLMDEIPAEHRNFGDVWTTTATSRGVYFQTSQRIFRWNGSSMQSWNTSDNYHTSFAVNDTFYVRIRGRGLFRMVEDELRLIPGGEQFSELHVFMMSPQSNDSILIGTRQEGLFVLEGSQITPLQNDLAPILRELRAYHGRKISTGGYAVATLGGGVLILDARGQLTDILTADYELPDNVVNYVYPDQQGGLWLALHNRGIVRVDIPTPLTVYGDDLGPDGIIYSIQRHDNTLYVATGEGLYYLDRRGIFQNGARQQSRFRQIPDIPPSWSLLTVDDILLIASQEGLYILDDEGPQKISDDRIFTLYRDDVSGSILAGTKEGVLSIVQTAEGWQIKPVLESITEEVRSIVRSPYETLWLGTISQSDSADGNVLRATADPDNEHGYSVERFGRSEGLPPGNIRIMSINQTPVFAARQGVFRFDEMTKRFYRDSSLIGHADTDTLLSFAEGEDNNLWMRYTDHVEVAIPGEEGTYQKRAPTALRLRQSSVAQIYAESTGVTWLSSDHQLIRYDTNLDKDYHHKPGTLVRRVEVLGNNQTIFGGTSLAADTAAGRHALAFEDNNLRFTVGAPFFNRPAATRFQYYLEGSDRDSTDWLSTPTRTFTKLPQGTYTFHARAKNIHGIVSETAAFDFRILPPWYRTWWAYLIYATLLGAGTTIAVRYRTLVREHQKARQQAEKLTRERLINERLQEANERLQKANEWKDTLVANTSHELRTPLTGILGFTKILKKELSGHHREFVDLIEANGERLLRTINRLLDLSQLEAGEMPVHSSMIDVNACIREVVQSLESLALEKNLDLRVDAARDDVQAYLDRDKLEEVVYNLVGNAIKFTEEGYVRISVEETDSIIRISVQDTGIGMTDDFLEEIFEAFTQESKGVTRSHGGTGLGLFITAQLVHLMDGEIDVESTKGKGTVFTVSFPHNHREQQL